MRCKACNTELTNTIKRTVELEDGSVLVLEEDLCSRCLVAIREGYSPPQIFSDFDNDDYEELEYGCYRTKPKEID